MEIRHLQSFIKVVEYASFSKAAHSLDYAQSTITAHIKNLEDELGAPLFDRLGKKIQLTALGSSFLQKAKQMIQLYEESTHMAHPTEHPRGSLTIGAPESLAVYRLPSIMRAFKQAYPEVYLTVKVGDCPELYDQITKGDVDIALMLDVHADHYEELEMEDLLEEEMVVVEANDDIPLQSNRHTPTVLYTEKGCSYRAVFDDYLYHNRIQPNHSMEFWSVEAIKQCVKCGLGIALLPAITVEEDRRQGKLTAIPWMKEGVHVRSMLAYHKHKWHSPAMKAFQKTTKAYFDEQHVIPTAQ
ncbi:LysR family transcriptional regulator [Pontibacillus halophilus JSM 076056 = DSM 19796]|uniref:LysR family transcriptional regulator n=1 Tax=Pontibacillus halophilus JSM 076056 = DSM 19796 TaxID=1385510 RepID=A0A0A5I9Z6_9BACI|nr:LysR family transcriptional regulator [Pontibacillus halophilus]KGX92657.1 LysR family transcriptional regulator [Pontibacillus halophilus JSM 076056 = DSM 19796]